MCIYTTVYEKGVIDYSWIFVSQNVVTSGFCWMSYLNNPASQCAGVNPFSVIALKVTTGEVDYKTTNQILI